MCDLGVFSLFTYSVSVTIQPEVLKPGTKAEGTATFSAVKGGKIAHAYASYPLFGQTELTRQSENIYTLAYTIPAIVPPGEYVAYVYAASGSGAIGPRVAVRLTISQAAPIPWRTMRPGP